MKKLKTFMKNQEVGLVVQEYKMIDLLYPDPAIDALETEVILPNRHLNPTLGVIIKTDAPKDDKAMSEFTNAH